MFCFVNDVMRKLSFVINYINIVYKDNFFNVLYKPQKYFTVQKELKNVLI